MNMRAWIAGAGAVLAASIAGCGGPPPDRECVGRILRERHAHVADSHVVELVQHCEAQNPCPSAPEGTTDVSRYTFGGEMAFWCGLPENETLRVCAREDESDPRDPYQCR
jgi:hypothetical protein